MLAASATTATGFPTPTRRSSTRCSRTVPGCTSTTPIPSTRDRNATIPLEAALADKAGERVMDLARQVAQSAVPPGQVVKLYKNNSDGKGNSYGAHENYLLGRETPFGRVIRYATTFMVTRQIFTGAGKVGQRERPTGRPIPDHPTGRLLRGRSRTRNDPEASTSSTPGTSHTATRADTADCT